MSKIILLADQDKYLVKSMEKLLKGSDYNLISGKTSQEVRDIFEFEAIDLIIVNMRLPDEQAYELLKWIKTDYPSTLRITLSDYSNNTLLYSAVDNSLARIFLYKPRKDQELIHFFESLFTIEVQLEDEALASLIKSITIPSLYLEISKMMNEHQSVFSITKVIEKDQAIASRVLKIANSAFYCAKTGDIKQAIMFIGLANVKI